MKMAFLGIPVDALTMDETINVIDNAIKRKIRMNHVAINAAKVVLMQDNEQLMNSILDSDLISADGQSIVWAARFLGCRIPERVTGIDLMQNIVSLASSNNYTCYFLGAKENVVKKVVEIYSKKYGSSIIAGYHNGYFEKKDEFSIAKEIADSGAKILFVAITSPKKEFFLHENYNIFSDVYFTMGVGGAFDVIAGIKRRAPRWMQNVGLEWFYRLIQEPGRMWYRYLVGNIKFIGIVLKEKIKYLKTNLSDKQMKQVKT